MTDEQQKVFGVKIGEDYPAPIVDHFKVKEEVLKRFKEITTGTENNNK